MKVLAEMLSYMLPLSLLVVVVVKLIAVWDSNLQSLLSLLLHLCSLLIHGCLILCTQRSRLESLREDHGVTMIWRTFVLDTFVTSPISDDFLIKIRHDLDALDSASFTAVLRFCYVFEYVRKSTNGLIFCVEYYPRTLYYPLLH